MDCWGVLQCESTTKFGMSLHHGKWMEICFIITILEHSQEIFAVLHCKAWQMEMKALPSVHVMRGNFLTIWVVYCMASASLSGLSFTVPWWSTKQKLRNCWVVVKILSRLLLLCGMKHHSRMTRVVRCRRSFGDSWGSRRVRGTALLCLIPASRLTRARNLWRT